MSCHYFTIVIFIIIICRPNWINNPRGDGILEDNLVVKKLDLNLRGKIR